MLCCVYMCVELCVQVCYAVYTGVLCCVCECVGVLQQLPVCFDFLLYLLTDILFALLVNIVSNPYFLLPIIPVFLLYLAVQRFYIASSRSVPLDISLRLVPLDIRLRSMPIDIRLRSVPIDIRLRSVSLYRVYQTKVSATR